MIRLKQIFNFHQIFVLLLILVIPFFTSPLQALARGTDPTLPPYRSNGIPFDIGEAAQGVLPGITAANSDQENYTSNFAGLVQSLLGIMMAVAALAVLIYMLWGAISWITAGGDSSKIEKARDRMMNAAIGIIVLGASLGIFIFLQQFLNICVVNFIGSCG